MRNLAVFATLLLAALPPTAVDAAEINTTAYANAPAYCNGALPSFEGALRKRPLAVQNEGTAPAFVTCGLATEGRAYFVEVVARSTVGTALTLTCTLVNGWDGGTTNGYSTKTVTLPADGGRDGFGWQPQDFGNVGTFAHEALSVTCNLPAGANINSLYVDFRREIGA